MYRFREALPPADNMFPRILDRMKIWKIILVIIYVTIACIFLYLTVWNYLNEILEIDNEVLYDYLMKIGMVVCTVNVCKLFILNVLGYKIHICDHDEPNVGANLCSRCNSPLQTDDPSNENDPDTIHRTSEDVPPEAAGSTEDSVSANNAFETNDPEVQNDLEDPADEGSDSQILTSTVPSRVSTSGSVTHEFTEQLDMERDPDAIQNSSTGVEVAQTLNAEGNLPQFPEASEEDSENVVRDTEFRDVVERLPSGAQSPRVCEGMGGSVSQDVSRQDQSKRKPSSKSKKKSKANKPRGGYSLP